MSSFPISRPMYNAEKSRPVQDPKYRAWIKTLPCAVPGCRRTHGIDPHHVGARGMGQTASDRRAIPLCRAHHEEFHRIGRRRFEKTYQLDIEALILKLNEKPKVRVMGGRYVAQLAGEDYDLGTVRKPMAVAISAALAICRERPLIMRL